MYHTSIDAEMLAAQAVGEALDSEVTERVNGLKKPQVENGDSYTKEREGLRKEGHAESRKSGGAKTPTTQAAKSSNAASGNTESKKQKSFNQKAKPTSATETLLAKVRAEGGAEPPGFFDNTSPLEKVVFGAIAVGAAIECPPLLAEPLASASMASLTGPIAEIDIIAGELGREAIAQAVGTVARAGALVSSAGFFGKKVVASAEDSLRGMSGKLENVGLFGKKGDGESVLRQTGSGNVTRLAEKTYDAIRKSTTDIESIARNTGIKPANIAKVKDHLFYNEHLLDRYANLGIPAEVKRFDSDLSIAQSWQRLERGAFVEEDIQLLRHETAEAWYMRRNGPGYSAAHNAAQARYPAPDLEEQLNNEYSNRFGY